VSKIVKGWDRLAALGRFLAMDWLPAAMLLEGEVNERGFGLPWTTPHRSADPAFGRCSA
jgi:hypothetical protein